MTQATNTELAISKQDELFWLKMQAITAQIEILHETIDQMFELMTITQETLQQQRVAEMKELLEMRLQAYRAKTGSTKNASVRQTTTGLRFQ